VFALHLVTTGLGPFFDGVGHLFLTIEDLLPVIALALLAGLRGPTAGRRVLFILPLAWVLGGAIGLATGIGAPSLLTVASFLVVGGLLALNAPLSDRAVTGVALVLGLLHGSMNGAAMAGTRNGLLELVGVATSLFVVIALAAAFVVTLSKPWTRVAVRVAGSWVVATGLLLLGWSLRA
jgi:hydrogenase/urease accessory protein HupE